MFKVLALATATAAVSLNAETEAKGIPMKTAVVVANNLMGAFDNDKDGFVTYEDLNASVKM